MTEMLILQSTAFCNINCSYCYLPNRNAHQRMSHDVLSAVFSKILSSPLLGERLAIVWHAGEPLTVPAAWYEAAFQLCEQYTPEHVTVDHVFQSNGMLLTNEWIAFFKRTGAKISLSIDGPDWLHDSERKTRAGQGTHERAMRGLRLLQENGVDPSIITVLTRQSLAYADSLFDFYRSNGVRDVAFNVEEIEGANVASSMTGLDAEASYRRFLARFIGRMRSEPGILTLREWRNATDALQCGVMDGFNQEAEPLRIISIAVDGSLSTFSPELLGLHNPLYHDYLFGNIVTDDIDTIVECVLSSPLLRDVQLGIANCRRTCGWFAWCGGGSPSNKLFETGDPRATETTYCRLTRQALLDVVLSSMEQSPLAVADYA